MRFVNIFKHAKETEQYHSGETIFMQGEAGAMMYVVRDGEVDIFIDDKLIETVGTGGIIGEMALIDTTQRSATVKAHTDCTLVPVDEKHFLYMVQETPYFALQVMQVLTDRLRIALTKDAQLIDTTA